MYAYISVLTDQGPDARNNEQLTTANNVTAYNIICIQILSKPFLDYLRLTLRCIASIVQPGPGN